MKIRKFDKQFIIGIIIIFIWAFFLYKPLRLIDSLSVNDGDLKGKISNILEAAAGVSALFSTALGFVLGHFFGKQGIENVQAQAAQAVEDKVKALQQKNTAVQITDTATDKYDELKQQLDSLKNEFQNTVGAVIDNLQKDS